MPNKQIQPELHQEHFTKQLKEEIREQTEGQTKPVFEVGIKTPEKPLDSGQVAVEVKPTGEIKSPRNYTQEIRRIIQEEVAEYWKKLPPQTQKDIQISGIDAIGRLGDLLRAEKPNRDEMLRVLDGWLEKFGLDKYYTLTSAKNKTEQIIALREQI